MVRECEHVCEGVVHPYPISFGQKVKGMYITKSMPSHCRVSKTIAWLLQTIDGDLDYCRELVTETMA